MQVINVWDVNAPVKIQWKDVFYLIPHDGKPHWIPDEVSDSFGGLLRIISKDPPKPIIPPPINFDFWKVHQIYKEPTIESIKELPKDPIEDLKISDEQIAEKLKELESFQSNPSCSDPIPFPIIEEFDTVDSDTTNSDISDSNEIKLDIDFPSVQSHLILSEISDTPPKPTYEKSRTFGRIDKIYNTCAVKDDNPKPLKGKKVSKKCKDKYNKDYIARVNTKKNYLNVANNKINDRFDLLDKLENNNIE